jgi:hypothetical protein
MLSASTRPGPTRTDSSVPCPAAGTPVVEGSSSNGAITSPEKQNPRLPGRTGNEDFREHNGEHRLGQAPRPSGDPGNIILRWLFGRVSIGRRFARDVRRGCTGALYLSSAETPEALTMRTTSRCRPRVEQLDDRALPSTLHSFMPHQVALVPSHRGHLNHHHRHHHVHAVFHGGPKATGGSSGGGLTDNSQTPGSLSLSGQISGVWSSAPGLPDTGASQKLSGSGNLRPLALSKQRGPCKRRASLLRGGPRAAWC